MRPVHFPRVDPELDRVRPASIVTARCGNLTAATATLATDPDMVTCERCIRSLLAEWDRTTRTRCRLVPHVFDCEPLADEMVSALNAGQVVVYADGAPRVIDVPEVLRK